VFAVSGWLSVIVPGLLVAATGVGAGDLATASFAGSYLGVAILWAVVVGGLLKLVLTEGLARWQLATGKTLLEGLAHHVGPMVGWVFLPYLLLWSFFVSAALMGACGVTLHALIPLFDDASDGKVVFGIASSLIGLALVWRGGFSLFAKIMGVMIGIMFVIVMIVATMLWPGTEQVLSGLLIPHIPQPDQQGISWTVALIGGVGGTLTILCYGYWIRENGRVDASDIRLMRVDVGVAYAVTILFGLAMVIIGSTLEIEGKGAGLLVLLGDSLREQLGPTVAWLFLLGALGTVFSSLLGVWQSVPYLFADVWRLFIKTTASSDPVDTNSSVYRSYMLALAIVPMVGLFMSFQDAQKVYAITGALFMPVLALALLWLNGSSRWVGRWQNGWLTTGVLLLTFVFFAYLAAMKWLA